MGETNAREETISGLFYIPYFPVRYLCKPARIYDEKMYVYANSPYTNIYLCFEGSLNL